MPQIDLFSSHLNYQVPNYFAWRADPQCQGFDAFQQDWRGILGYAYPPFCLIGNVLAKARNEPCKLLIITPAWQKQNFYSRLPEMSIQHPIFISWKKTF